MSGRRPAEEERTEEAWVGRLRSRVDALVPEVPVDVPSAVNRGRRRRRAQALGSVAVVTVAVAGAVLAGPLLGTPGGVVPVAMSGTQESGTQESGTDGSAAQGGGPADDAEGEERIGAIRVQRELLGDAESERLLVQLEMLSAEQEAAEAAARASLALAMHLEGIATSYGLTDLPAVEPVAVVPAGEWSRSQVQCLVGRGWQATVTGTGFQVSHGPDEEEAFGQDLYACAAAYPADVEPRE